MTYTFDMDDDGFVTNEQYIRDCPYEPEVDPEVMRFVAEAARQRADATRRVEALATLSQNDLDEAFPELVAEAMSGNLYLCDALTHAGLLEEVDEADVQNGYLVDEYGQPTGQFVDEYEQPYYESDTNSNNSSIYDSDDEYILS